MKHASEHDLALLSGGDLGPLERWRLNRHLARCEQCRLELAAFASSVAAVAGQSLEMPRGVRWERLAPEMAANIRLGLAAGACVTSAAPAAERLTWRPAAVLGSATAVLVAAWWINIAPLRQTPRQELALHQASAETAVVQPAAEGIEVKTSSGALTLLRPRKSSQALYVSSPGSLRERFVDDETGQVTINNVYSE